MRTIILSIAMLAFAEGNAQCTADFSFVTNWDTVAFTNQSSMSNAHYYWNFGDGSTEYASNPVHVFSASGHYLVTLYGLDTLSLCHSYHEQWIDVLKQSIDPCQPVLIDSIVTSNGEDFIASSIASTDCDMYQANIDAGPAWNDSPNNWIWLGGGWGHALWADRLKYHTADSINGYVLRAEYYRTLPYNYDRSVSYEDSSANFEFHADYQQDGAIVSFRAMAHNGVDTFYVNGQMIPASSGSRNLGYLDGDTHSHWLIQHWHTLGGWTANCTQTLVLANPNYVEPPSCAIVQPLAQMVYAGGDAQFTIESGPGTEKQWQQNDGLGWQDLSDSGPFHGVHTDTLTVSNCQNWWNNYLYRCVVTASMSWCHNTSSAVALSVMVGIDELTNDPVLLYPDPVIDVMHVRWKEGDNRSSLRITNAMGSMVMSEEMVGSTRDIDVADLPSGIYLLTVVQNGRELRNPFVKR